MIRTQVHEELSRLPRRESVPRYLTLGCFLIREGADPCARNNLGQTPAQACPSDTRDILLNYVNKSKLDYNTRQLSHFIGMMGPGDKLPKMAISGNLLPGPYYPNTLEVAGTLLLNQPSCLMLYAPHCLTVCLLDNYTAPIVCTATVEVSFMGV